MLAILSAALAVETGLIIGATIHTRREMRRFRARQREVETLAEAYKMLAVESLGVLHNLRVQGNA